MVETRIYKKEYKPDFVGCSKHPGYGRNKQDTIFEELTRRCISLGLTAIAENGTFLWFEDGTITHIDLFGAPRIAQEVYLRELATQTMPDTGTPKGLAKLLEQKGFAPQNLTL